MVGAGASGLLAAGRAAEAGADVVLLEKTDGPGKKLLLTGNGRCNLSNALPLDVFVSRYGSNGRFLFPAFHVFFRDELRSLLEVQGVPTRVEPDGRVFPASDDARDVLEALVRYAGQGSVTTLVRTRGVGLNAAHGRVVGVETPSGRIAGDAVVVATGGLSYPHTGSSGDGYRLAASAGHAVTRLRPALVPLVACDDGLVARMQGVSLHGVGVTSCRCPADEVAPADRPMVELARGAGRKRRVGAVIERRVGDVMITHYGLSGPAVLLVSLGVVDALAYGPASVAIDMFPRLSTAGLRAELQRRLDLRGGGTVLRVLQGLVQPKMAAPLLDLAGVQPDRKSALVSAEERDRLVPRLKSLAFDISGPLSTRAATVTAGGVSLREVDPRTMESRLVKGLFFCGEVLDVDGESGGFNLQAAFSTGYVAGLHSALSA